MTNLEKFKYVVRNWYLKDGIIYSHHTGRPVAFTSGDKFGHPGTHIHFNGAMPSIFLHRAVFVLYHNRPINEGAEIHHIDGNPLNNHLSNLVELTPKQHKRIHTYQCNDPLHGISLMHNLWCYRWVDNEGKRHSKNFHGINEAMKFRAEIEEPYREELRALGLKC